MDMADLEDEQLEEDKPITIEEVINEDDFIGLQKESIVEIEAPAEEVKQIAVTKSQVSHVSVPRSVKEVKFTNRNSAAIAANNEQFDDLVAVNPQDTFMTNCKFNEQHNIGGEITFLSWTLMGTIQLRKSM